MCPPRILYIETFVCRVHTWDVCFASPHPCLSPQVCACFLLLTHPHSYRLLAYQSYQFRPCLSRLGHLACLLLPLQLCIYILEACPYPCQLACSGLWEACPYPSLWQEEQLCRLPLLAGFVLPVEQQNLLPLEDLFSQPSAHLPCPLKVTCLHYPMLRSCRSYLMQLDGQPCPLS